MLCVGGQRSKYVLKIEDHSECWGRRSLVDCWVILSIIFLVPALICLRKSDLITLQPRKCEKIFKY
jgi:hypothetical protein